ncbi:MAG: ISC system 2Fe-2S type ferredoxin [Endozoicomonadaceae bacterium]|nr:ISC system 2Fe-2S type ferredoxin [Endozoicomonadaceae bacterium]MBE8233647.1 ISC system 2Fe-2S type ferredoxin [Endozoicomonadaceae bacterium]
MTKTVTIEFLPHETYCPNGKRIQVDSGTSILDAALAHGIPIEHACEKSCACTTCHVVIRKGFDSLKSSNDFEDDLLDKAWGLEAESRLSCQALVAQDDLIIDIPKYTINQVSEKR